MLNWFISQPIFDHLHWFILVFIQFSKFLDISVGNVLYCSNQSSAKIVSHSIAMRWHIWHQYYEWTFSGFTLVTSLMFSIQLLKNLLCPFGRLRWRPWWDRFIIIPFGHDHLFITVDHLLYRPLMTLSAENKMLLNLSNLAVPDV